MEYVREGKITLQVDTNKRTLKEDFNSLSQLQDFLDDLVDSGLPVIEVMERNSEEIKSLG